MIKKALNLFFENKCALCKKPTDGALCTLCKTPLRLLNFGLCQRCGKPVKSCICKSLDKAAVRVVSAYKYEEPAANALIHKLKSKGNRQVVEFLADAMAKKFKDEYLNISFDFVTFVPTSRAKLAQKGFDHAKLLAEKLSEKLDLPLSLPPLKRRPGAAQKYLTKASRKDNAAYAFKLCKNRSVSGTALLVDDVVTSGATISACACLLTRAGTDKVYCLTAATATYKS